MSFVLFLYVTHSILRDAVFVAKTNFWRNFLSLAFLERCYRFAKVVVQCALFLRGRVIRKRDIYRAPIAGQYTAAGHFFSRRKKKKITDSFWISRGHVSTDWHLHSPNSSIRSSAESDPLFGPFWPVIRT